MKRTLLFLAAGAMLLGAGYWLGRPEGDHVPERKTGLTAGTSKGTGIKTATDSTATAKASPVFAGARPFAEGHATEWLVSFLRDGNSRKARRTPMEWEQLFLIMDESSAQEAAAALKRIFSSVESESHERFDINRSLYALDLLSFRLSQFDPDARAKLMSAFLTSEPDKADPIPGIQSRSRYIEAEVLQRMLDENPGQALNALAKLPSSEKGYEKVRSALEQWRRKDAAAAREWAEAYTGPGQMSVKGWVLERTAWYDPQSALPEFTKLLRSAQDPRELAATARALASSLAADDLPAAREWMTGLSGGVIRDEVLPAVVQEWVKEDSEGASAWIAKLAPGKERDTAATLLVARIYEDDPSAAREWANTIKDQEKRLEAMALLHRNEVDAAAGPSPGAPDGTSPVQVEE
ncbi:MAG TPA: hypothetical protein VHM91_14345 [Verrucomicrobiales bacterium]|nr:hypothetical protein [Verrucomicrobiales bacterium]